MKRLLLCLAIFVGPGLFAARRAPSNYDQIDAAITRGTSASVVLQNWCADHRLPALSAWRVRGADRAPDRQVLAALAVGPGERVRYRRVSLGCGRAILSEADNWYLPHSLSRAMNRRLDASDAPFGLVVRSIGFHRQTLLTRRHPDARHVLEVRALLVNRLGAPFSYVIEDYTYELARPD